MDAKIRIAVLDCLKDWATQLAKQIGTEGVFLFGSLIYKEGAQFNDATSDVDLVVLVPRNVAKDALARALWLEQFREHKAELEARLGSVLNRADAEAPIVSIVVATGTEIAADVHKDGAHDFFAKNQFFDVCNDTLYVGLPHAGELHLDERLVIECLRFAQKKRNAFVGVNARSEGGLAAFDDKTDPVPKDIMRHAAMAAALTEGATDPGAEYDTQKGLDLISDHLYDLRGTEARYGQLHDRVSVRRGGRGERRPLSPQDQMLLAECVRDLARHAYKANHAAPPSLKGRSSTAEFADRFAQAFPGAREIAWIDDPADIKQRLEKLLGEPLVYSDGTPVWWFGNGNLQIESFINIGPGLYLMNDVEELKIRRIAGAPGRAYYQNFVYVECDPMPPTGLYPNSERHAADAITRGDFSSEEYGLLEDGRFITRAEFDDGAAVIDGQLVDVRGKSRLRVRYLTPYAFVVTAHASPINNNDFDERLHEFLRAILSEKGSVEELAAAVRRLPKRQN